jgi:hypothetical protein
MVLAFLRAELRSPMLAMRFVLWLSRHGYSRSLLDEANLESDAENELRRRVLGGWRGYRQNSLLFVGFPDDVRWHNARMTSAELADVKYATEPSWDRLSGGTRLTSDGAKNLGVIALPDDGAKHILAIARAIRSGRAISDLILVGRPNANPDELVLVEGHKRATAHVFVGEDDAKDIDALVGLSERIGEWERF